MKVRIRRIDKELELPAYKTSGAVAMDCVVREGAIIAPGELKRVPLNVVVKPPRGHFLLLAARGGLHKRGLMMGNSVGIGDEDFAGDNDEYHAPLYNFGKEPVEVKRGERVAQILILPFDRVEWEEVDHMDDPNRGGFGTTGL